MRFDHRAVLFVFPLIMLLMGCSSAQNPGAPAIDDQSSILQSQARPIAMPDNRYLWAYGEIAINPDDMTYEILPARQVMEHWNVLRWIEQGPCYNCFKIKALTQTPKGTLQLTIEITHPFPSMNLTGFDVRGIAMSYGSYIFPDSGLMTTSRKSQEGELVNADGYTTLYNPTTFGAGPGGLQGYIQGARATIPWPNTTLNGFKRHVTDDPNNIRNAFYAGTSNSQVYEIYKPLGSFILGYAIDACWAPPTTTPVISPRNDFPPEANCSEPWKIEVTEAPVGLGFTTGGGTVVLTIDVYDYEGKMTHFSPRLECPQIFTGTRNAAYKSTGDGYARFEITVDNENLPPDGLYKCLISVEDVENSDSPDYMDLTAYYIHEFGVGMQAPPNVSDFEASDADPSLPDRKIRLTWEPLSASVDYYDIERRDYEWGSGWHWNLVKSAPHPESEWIDGNPRYCGPGDPIEYRISARNDAGSSPGYATDTGYPTPRRFGIAMWCVADDASGNGAVTSWNRASSDFNWANQFWNRYGLDFELDNTDGFFWVGNSSYKNLNGNEPTSMHDSYGHSQQPDNINVYYVNAAEGDSTMAYCMSMCPAEYHTTENIFVIMGRDSSGPPPNGIPITLAHEFGHAIGHFWDVYLLDRNHNIILDDGSSCQSDNTWCNQPPYHDPLFCDANACYQQGSNPWARNPWNLMWYSVQGKSVTNYNLTDTQFVYLHDWIHTNRNNYPWPD